MDQELLKKVDAGNAVAQYELGAMYHHGRGVPQDEEKAIEFYTKAAEQDHCDAQLQLGDIYLFGDAHQDDKKAFAWYLQAANQGFHQAQTNVGTMFLTGRGVSQDNTKALEWFIKAAKQGNETAQSILSKMNVRW
jgi:TPR repeat protein